MIAILYTSEVSKYTRLAVPMLGVAALALYLVRVLRPFPDCAGKGRFA